MTTATTATSTVSDAVLTAKTICLATKMGTFGNKKQASLARARFTERTTPEVDGEPDGEVEPDKRLLTLTKTLIDSPELEAVRSFDRETVRLLDQIGAVGMFRKGVRLISVTQVEHVDALLRAREQDREALVEAAVGKYDQRCEETSNRLSVLNNPGDYPSKAEFRRKFHFSWQWIAWQTPEKLKTINASIFKAEQEKAAAFMMSVAEECRQAMRAGLRDMVAKLAERLEPGPDGKRKRLHETAVTNLSAFLQSFELRDVTDDAELGALVQRAREVLDGVGIDALKAKTDTAESLRLDVSMKLKALAGDLEAITTTRVITFGDDGE